DTVQDSAMVAETDIGRVQPGLPVTISVDAFPNRTFDGTVLKIGPQAAVVQNITTFPVFVNIPNPGHLLKPGMNTDARIHTGRGGRERSRCQMAGSSLCPRESAPSRYRPR